MSGKYTELFLLLEKQHAIVIATQSDFTRQEVLDYAAGENIIVLYNIVLNMTVIATVTSVHG